MSKDKTERDWNTCPDLTPEQIEWLLKQPIPQAKRKVIHTEVSPRMFDAVKHDPSKLRMQAEDASGNAVIERPAAARSRVFYNDRAICLDEVGPYLAELNRCRPEPRAAFEHVHYPAGTPMAALTTTSPNPEQTWTARRDRYSGELRYVSHEGSNSNVVHQYDILAVLREDD